MNRILYCFTIRYPTRLRACFEGNRYFCQEPSGLATYKFFEFDWWWSNFGGGVIYEN